VPHGRRLLVIDALGRDHPRFDPGANVLYPAALLQGIYVVATPPRALLSHRLRAAGPRLEQDSGANLADVRTGRSHAAGGITYRIAKGSTEAAFVDEMSTRAKNFMYLRSAA